MTVGEQSAAAAQLTRSVLKRFQETYPSKDPIFWEKVGDGSVRYGDVYSILLFSNSGKLITFPTLA